MGLLGAFLSVQQYSVMDMDDFPVKNPGPIHHKIILSRKSLDFYLRLLLLLESVKYNQSLMQHCPLRKEAVGFPNFTSKAGSPFIFKLPTPVTTGHTQHYQLSLAHGDSTLPHWMEFRRQTSSLAGLALTEDCGTYRLKVSVNGEKHAAYFYLHILNRAVTEKDSARDTSSCSEGEMTTWANLLLQLNPATFDASRRIRLVVTMADYLRLPLEFVYLFSRRKSFIQQQEELRVCRQGGLADKITRGNEKQVVAQLLWRVGCQGDERQSDLAKVLDYSVTAGVLDRLLEAPVLGWRVLCASRVVRHEVKRELQRLKFTPTPDVIVAPPTQIRQTVKHEHSHVCSLPLTELEPSLSTILLHMKHMGTRMEITHAEDLLQPSGARSKKVFMFTSKGNAFTTLMYSDMSTKRPTVILKTNHLQNVQVSTNSLFSIVQTLLHPHSEDVFKMISTTLHTSVSVDFGKRVSEVTSDTSLSISEYFRTTELFHSPFLPEQITTARTFLGELSADTAPSLLPSSRLHSIYPSLPLTPDSYGVTSTLTHEAVDRKSLATRLTLRPRSEETPLRTGAYRGSHTDSESPPTVSSLGHIKDHLAAEPTLHNLPSVSHPPLTENHNDVLLLNSRSNTVQSPPPSNKIPSTQLNPDVSPTSYFMTEQLPITQHSETIQHLSSALNQDVMPQRNVTTQDVSSTTLAGQLTLSGQTELESSLSMSWLEPSATTFTPALPSELGFFSGQLETPHIMNPAESLKASSSTTPPSQTSSRSLPPDVSVSSLQKNLESPVLCFDQNELMQTSDSGILLTSLHQAYPFSALQMSLPLTKTCHIISVPLSIFQDQLFEGQLSLESMQSMPLMQQTLHTLLLVESLQMDRFSYTSLVTELTTSVHVLTAFAPSATHSAPLESTRHMCEDHFDPTAPSAVQEPHTTPFIHQIHSLDPSFPVCDQPVAQDHIYASGCTLKIKSAYLESTVEHLLDVLTSYSRDEKSAFQSQLFMFDSSGEVSPTRTSNPATHLSAPAEINHLTATPQMDISLEDSGFSVITFASLAPSTSALSIENSLLIRQTGHPTQQILSTALSPRYGTSTTLLTSLQAVGFSSYRRQSSVQPTPSSASISNSMNLPPKVLRSIPVLTATVGFPFHYSIPPQTFLDPEDGEADALSLEIRLIDGPPLSVGTWLALDGLELHGVPLEVDLHFAPQHLLLAARDGQGLSTWLPLTLDLRRSSVDPCHVFTLTAQRSLHSILRHRRRVELLVRKLSRFFNSSGDHHVSVVSMRPGSTVVSWYNYSLCGVGRNRVRRCLVDQIQSMWLAMRSADGSVNPAFRASMLPEFPITKVGPVSYRQDCFSTTSTPTPSLGTNTSFNPTSSTCISASPATTATSQLINHQWMAGAFTGLLLVCLLILIVLLVAVVLHFCKGRGRSRAVAIWPAGRVLSVQSSRDLLRAIKPRRPPLFQPELPPPPLRLWISLSQDDDGPSTCERGRKTFDKALQPRPPHYDFSNI